MDLALEFMKFVEEQPDQSVDLLLDKILLKCRLLLGAEAGTIFLIEEKEDGALSVRPMSLQNDAVDMSTVELELTVDKESLAGYVASSGETVFVTDTYDPPADLPFGMNHTIDRLSGYKTVSVLAFPIQTYSEAVVGVVQLINRRVEGVDHPVAFEASQVDLIRPVNQFIGRAIQRTVLLDELRARNADLGQSNVALADEVTTRLQAEQALRAAVANADVANRAKSEFLANISHELRTPLNSIIGFSQIIADQKYGPVGVEKYVGYAEDIIASGTHLLDVITDILDLSKSESGKAELHEVAIDMREVVATAVQIMGARAETAGLTLSAQISDDLPELIADERMVKQILINLLSNAVKFTPEGNQVRIQVGVDETGEYYLSVNDDGRGIAPEDIPKAIAPFGQVDSAFSRSYEGTGLGLPLVKSMAEMHGGRMDLESQIGVGTTVTVHFPAGRVGRHVNG